MRPFTSIGQRLGFTHTEVRVILFLSLTFLAGVTVRWLRNEFPALSGETPRFDYSRSDSIFFARSQASTAVAPAGRDSAGRSARAAKELPAPGSIDINTAGIAELNALPGIGESTAKRIIEERETNGPFRSVEDLARVRGIKEKKLERLRPYVTVSREGDSSSPAPPRLP